MIGTLIVALILTALWLGGTYLFWIFYKYANRKGAEMMSRIKDRRYRKLISVPFRVGCALCWSVITLASIKTIIESAGFEFEAWDFLINAVSRFGVGYVTITHTCFILFVIFWVWDRYLRLPKTKRS